MESISKLREICQAPRRDSDNWHMRHISRKPSIYITWALLHTHITANGATFLFLLSGVVASIVFLFGTKPSFLIAAFLLQLWYVMDMVDGEIARYRKQTSFTGVYFDCIAHYIINPMLFLCIGLGLYRMGGNNLVILLVAMLAGYSISMINISTDMLQAVFYYRSKKSSVPMDNAEKSLKAGKKNIFFKSFSFLHTLCVFPSVMNAIFMVSLVDFLIHSNLMSVLVKFYAAAAAFIWVARVSFFIMNKKADE